MAEEANELDSFDRGNYVSDSHDTVNWLTWHLWQRKLTNLAAMTEGVYVSDSHDTGNMTSVAEASLRNMTS